jgi:hypothetical protein
MTRTFRKSVAPGAYACLGTLLAIATSISTAATPTPGNDTRLWGLVERLGHAVEAGSPRVFDEWPGGAIAMPEASTGRLQVVEGGTFGIDGSLRARRSQIRVDGGTGKVRLVDIDLEGRCLTPADVLRRYPDAIIIQRPSGHSPNERTYYATRVGSVRAAFGFPARAADCLAAIILDPNAPAPR